MSTELKPVGPMVPEHDNKIALTQFAGPKREDGGDNRRLQLTCHTATGWQYIHVSKDQALELALALVEWNLGHRERE